MSDDLVTVLETDDQTEAVLYRAMLEGAGIRVLQLQLRNPGLLSSGADLALPRFRLQVFAPDAEHARALIAEYRLLAHANEISIRVPDAHERPEERGFPAWVHWLIAVLILVAALLLLTPVGGSLRSLLGR
ncbi:MAG TPA: DUF2007 domain-containing protein [Armatimonadota bacterium]|nr:DUF2007 domain-containing protein [Armatimonadota bacterium]